MRHYYIKEDSRPKKLRVFFSSEIKQLIDSIEIFNQVNADAVSQWVYYLEGLINYISNPVIAWDYTNKHARLPNGARFIKDFNYNVCYSIIIDKLTNLPCVYVFKLNLSLEEFGLKMPPLLGSKQSILTESELEMLGECIKQVLSEATINGHTYPLEKQMGKWKCIDGVYWERYLPDCPEKGDVYDVRLYDNTDTPKGKYETYALWKRIDNGKYFYTTIVPSPEGNNQTQWKPMPLSKVPQETRDDLRHLPLPPVTTNYPKRV